MRSNTVMRKSIPSFFNTVFNIIKHPRRLFKRSEADHTLRETLEELIEERALDETPMDSDEKQLLGNVLNLRDRTVEDVMVPRSDIIAVPQTVELDVLIKTFLESRFHHLLVYRSSLDDIVGMINIRDILTWKESVAPVDLRTITRDILFISPTMRMLDLIVQMRETGIKMAVVVDEFGGVDGLVTFGGLVEEIIGDIQESQDQARVQELLKRPDGTIISDGRTMLDDIETTYHIPLLVNGVEDEIETIGGLVTTLAGYVPTRGEVIDHPTEAYQFEVIEADPRRIKKLAIRPKEPQVPPARSRETLEQSHM